MSGSGNRGEGTVQAPRPPIHGAATCTDHRGACTVPSPGMRSAYRKLLHKHETGGAPLPSQPPHHAGRSSEASRGVRLPQGECGVWWADPGAAGPRLAAILSGAEHERWRRFRFDHDRAAYLAAHALTRIVAGGLLGIAPGDVSFETACANCGGPHGKPKMPGGVLEFSITHSRRRVGVAFAHHLPVGIDVEDVTADRLGAALALTVLAPAEQAALASLPEDRRSDGFLRYWTRKEALLKATGLGLSVSPELVTVTAPGD